MTVNIKTWDELDDASKQEVCKIFQRFEWPINEQLELAKATYNVICRIGAVPAAPPYSMSEVGR